MRDDFCAFILTHGRPDNVSTYSLLKTSGYTGKIYIVVDDEDKTYNKYVDNFGDKVLLFSKEEVSKTFDQGDNFTDRRVIIYARNACFDLAAKVGCKYFIQLDDDYHSCGFRYNKAREYVWTPAKDLDTLLEVLLEYYEEIPALSVCFSQGGDHLGGSQSSDNQAIWAKRKAMNTFICSVDRPFKFFGRINEDVNTYVTLGRRGELFLTFWSIMVGQKTTQSNAGGMTEAYEAAGTYVKSFYTVMYAPSCVKIEGMHATHTRLHHKVSWVHATPMIIRDDHKKAL